MLKRESGREREREGRGARGRGTNEWLKVYFLKNYLMEIQSFPRAQLSSESALAAYPPVEIKLAQFSWAFAHLEFWLDWIEFFSSAIRMTLMSWERVINWPIRTICGVYSIGGPIPPGNCLTKIRKCNNKTQRSLLRYKVRFYVFPRFMLRRRAFVRSHSSMWVERPCGLCSVHGCASQIGSWELGGNTTFYWFYYIIMAHQFFGDVLSVAYAVQRACLLVDDDIRRGYTNLTT